VDQLNKVQRHKKLKVLKIGCLLLNSMELQEFFQGIQILKLINCNIINKIITQVNKTKIFKKFSAKLFNLFMSYIKKNIYIEII